MPYSDRAGANERMLTMYNDMLGKLVRLIVTVPGEWLGTLCDLIEKVTSLNGEEWYKQLLKFLRKEATWVKTPETHPEGRYFQRNVWVTDPEECSYCGHPMSHNGQTWVCRNCHNRL